MQDRLCDCGRGVQNESHVVFECAKTEDIRARYNVNREVYREVAGLMSDMDGSELVGFVYECMKIFK